MNKRGIPQGKKGLRQVIKFKLEWEYQKTTLQKTKESKCTVQSLALNALQ